MTGDRHEQQLRDVFGAVHAPSSLDRWRERPAPAFRTGPSASVVIGSIVAVALITAGAGAFTGLHSSTNPSPHHLAQAARPGTPPARLAAALAADPTDRSVVMFGGLGSTGALGDTWVWNGEGWYATHPAAAPSARAGALLAYDAPAQELVLFGGVGISSGAPQPQACGSMSLVSVRWRCLESAGPSPALFADTWVWNGSAWSLAEADGAGPWFDPAATRMATDPVSGHPVLVTACPVPSATTTQVRVACHSSAQAPASATWEWQGGRWVLTNASLPAAFPNANPGDWALGAAGDLVAFAGAPAAQNGLAPGTVSGSYVLAPGASAWRLTQNFTSGPQLTNGTLAQDPTGQVLYSGNDGSTWLWNGGWSRLTAVRPAFSLASVAFDPASNDDVLFGGIDVNGSSATLSNSTWTWDGSAWTQSGGAPGLSNASPTGAPASSP